MAKNPFNSKSFENKPLFAAYINMARHNLFIVIKHISKALQLKVDAIRENNLHECELIALLGHRRKPELTQRAIKMFDRYMPFIKPMLATDIQNINKTNDKKQRGEQKESNAITPQMYHQGLVLLIKTLNAYRNEYTHFDAVNCWTTDLLSQQNRLIQYLKNAFDGGRRVVKERFSMSDDDMNFLTGSERYEELDKLDENGHAIYDRRGRKQKIHRERKEFYYKLDRKEDDYFVLSSTGLVMFIAMFLHKQYAKILIDKSGLFRDRCPDEKEKKIIFEIFSVYHLKLINDRIESTQPKYALGLDILNELQKCPKELYETLNDGDKESFRIINDEGNENLLMRYSDRFPQLAMRYIDQYDVLPGMCFQVALGKYKHTFYDKKCADAEVANRVRSLEKEVSGYGKLDAAELARKQQYGAIMKDPATIDSAQSTPYITDHKASYMITGNRIGIMYNDAHRQVLTNNLYIPQLKGKDTRNEYPVCWLSIYELPALLYHHLLSKENADATASIIKKYVAAYRTLFADIASGALSTVGEDKYDETIVKYGLKPTAIPKEVQNYLKGVSVDVDDKINDYFYSKLEQLLAETDLRLERFNADIKLSTTKDNKFGKKQYVVLKPGALAAWIAQDLVKWVPSAPKKGGRPAGWNKPTGLNFSVMQSNLALYNGDIDALRRLFVNLGIIGGDYPHYFIEKVINSCPGDVLQLYKLYLAEKRQYIKDILSEKVSEKEFLEVAELFTPSTQRRWKLRTPEWYKNLASRYLQAPIELPRGLFEQPIKTLVKELYAEDEDIMALLNKERCNVAHLIVETFRINKGDDSQPFYDAYEYPRTYRYFNVVNNHKVRNKLTELYLTTGEMSTRAVDEKSRNAYLSTISDKDRAEEANRLVRLLNRYKENEKTIRRYRVQDVIMYQLSTRILMDNRFENVKTYHLKDIYPNSDGGILSMPITFTLNLTMKDGSSVTIKQEGLKIKNYGDFYQFIYDERVLSLLPYIHEAQVDRSELVKELETYEANRPEVFAIIHKYEKNIIQNTPEEILQQQIEIGGRRIDVKNNFRSLMKIGGTLSEKDINEIAEVRNAFSHNHYPDKDVVNISEHQLGRIAQATKIRIEPKN